MADEVEEIVVVECLYDNAKLVGIENQNDPEILLPPTESFVGTVKSKYCALVICLKFANILETVPAFRVFKYFFSVLSLLPRK